jgi:prepilin peptidase CpaA
MQLLLAALVVTAAAFDIRYRKIPNWLALAGFLAGVSLSYSFLNTDGLKQSFLGASLAFAVYFPLFALRAMGAGDLKLMLAVAAFTGPSNWIGLFLITAMLGGVIAVVLLLYRGQLRRTLGNLVILLEELSHFRRPYQRRPELDIAHPGAVRLPHAVSISGGTLVFLLLDYYKGS